MYFKIVPLTEYLKEKELRVINGKKVLRRHNGYIETDCIYCRETGIDYDGISVCAVCRGKKKNLVEEPAITCAFCKGKGSSIGTSTVCRVCHGKGLVHINEPIETCPECGGKGRISATNLICIKCNGKGVVNKR